MILLVDDAGLMRRQLTGEDIPWSDALPLRDDISTDEITPAHCCFHHDRTLGQFAYLGFRAGDAFPVEAGAVQAGGFAVSVSGRRRGKGSSREQSPFAELAAGIRLVIARSHERIYRENCQHLGILTSTDFTLIERIRRGEAISLDELTRGEGPISRDIIEAGGLLPYSKARRAGGVVVPAPDSTPRPMTLAEKIIARHWVRGGGGDDGVPFVRPGEEGFVRTDIRFSHEYVTPMAAMLWREHFGAEARVSDPGSVFLFRDHLTFLDQALGDAGRGDGLLDLALDLKRAQEEFAAEQGIRLYGETGRGSEAICHSRILEAHALPGQVVVGSDSHTPHSGALGCLAFGIGTTALANAWLTRDVRITVPRTVLIRLHGRKPANVTAKDFMLQILRHPVVKDGGAIGRVVEYTGPAVAELSIDERATMTNMAAEVGAFSGIVAPDEKVVEFLLRERGLDRAEARRLMAGLSGDPGAEYERIIEIDAGSLEPLVALPGDPGNGRPITELGAPVRIDIAYAGSCTAGKKEDMDMYAAVLEAAARAGTRVHPEVRFLIQMGSQEVRRYAEAKGYLELFRSVGAEVLEPGCGACINAGPGVSHRADTVTISAINRNFPGRSGPGQVYLASPYTTAASAVAGRIVAWEPAADSLKP
ncbi:MAG TPA: aconitase family protein [Gemmatimonadales bacterium]|nr:aconitase family protein [Gemmatimonadales bacterium]